MPLKHMIPKVRSKWNGEKGTSEETTKLTEFCPVCLPVSTVQAEIFALLMFETNADTMRHDNVLGGIEGTNVTSVGHCKNSSSKRRTFKDTIHDMS